MEGRFKPKSKVAEQKQNLNYREKRKELIDPFLKIEDKLDMEVIADLIAEILDDKRDYFLQLFQSGKNDMIAVAGTAISRVSKAIKEERISEKAPWSELLKKKMLGLEIYLADSEAKINPEQRKKELNNALDRIHGLFKELGLDRKKPGSDEPGKK